jgi:hypothetical protein
MKTLDTSHPKCLNIDPTKYCILSVTVDPMREGYRDSRDTMKRDGFYVNAAPAGRLIIDDSDLHIVFPLYP